MLVERRALIVLAIGLAAGIAVERTLAVTGTGAVVRAVSEDPGAAALLGVPTERVVLLAFAFAGALAGLAGVLIAPDAAVGPADGALLGLKGVAAALIGGLASLRLAVVGGLVLGVLEAFAETEFGGGWGDVVALALLVVLAGRAARLPPDDRPSSSTSTCSRRHSGSCPSWPSRDCPSSRRARSSPSVRSERCSSSGPGCRSAARCCSRSWPAACSAR